MPTRHDATRTTTPPCTPSTAPRRRALDVGPARDDPGPRTRRGMLLVIDEASGGGGRAGRPLVPVDAGRGRDRARRSGFFLAPAFRGGGFGRGRAWGGGPGAPRGGGG